MPFPDYSQPVRIVMPLYEQPIIIFTSASSSIATLQDLKERRVSTGLAGSITEELAGYILKALEIQEKDFSRASFDEEESLSALKEGSIDAFFWSGNVADVATMSNMDLTLLPIRGADAETVMQGNPGIFHIGKIPAASSVLDSDFKTLSVTPVLLTMEGFPGDVLQQVLISLSDKYQFEENINADIKAYFHEGTTEYFLTH